MNSNGATNNKLDGAGDPGAMGGAGRQPLNFRDEEQAERIRKDTAFWYTNWDRLPRSGINIGSGTTFRYANSLGHIQAAIDISRLEDQ
uniref:Uncharacterized protein n=1 Tax=Solanum tuberosum TaxID=4113 RepID=M1DD53_SOLTU